MDHETALRSQAAERYILGELPSPERDAFEEHLSDCSRCLDDVTSLDVFAANAKREFEAQRTSSESPSPSWLTRLMPRFAPALAFSGAMNLVLLVALGYGMVHVLPALRSRVTEADAPRAAQTLVVHGLTRGGPEVYTLPRSGPVPVFRFDLPQQFQALTYSMEGQKEPFRRSGSLQVPSGGETVDLTVPLAGLEPGDYIIRVSGVDGSRTQEVGAWMIRVAP